MKAEKKWQKRLAAAILGAMVAGMPLFAAHAEEAAFSRDGERYNVRRGMYEKDGGSDEHVRLGQYADERHREARDEERREDLDKRQSKEREDFEKRQAEERKAFENRQSTERNEHRQEHRDHDRREEHRDHDRHEEHRDHSRHEEHRDHDRHEEHRDEHRGGPSDRQENRAEGREYRYDVRRGMYEQEGGSDEQVRRGQYEQPSEDGMRRGLVR